MSMKLRFVRGNDVLLKIYISQAYKNEADEIYYKPIDLDSFDIWKMRIFNVNSPLKKYDIIYNKDDQIGIIVADIKGTLPCGIYSAEFTAQKNGRKVRSFEVPVFQIVENNLDANITFDIINCQKSLDTDIKIQMVPTAKVQGMSSYDYWKMIPGNEDKTILDYLDTFWKITETDPTVPDWAKQPNKPSYTAAEVGALPINTIIPTVPTNISAFNNDVGYLIKHLDLSAYALKSQLFSKDYNDLTNKPIIPIIPTNVSAFINDAGYISEETDPTVPDWAKAPQKPAYTAEEVGALPATTPIPTSLAELTDDVTHRTVSDAEKTAWNGKQDALLFSEHGYGRGRLVTDSSGTRFEVFLVTDKGTEIENIVQGSDGWDHAGDTVSIPTISAIESQGYLTQHQDVSGKEDKMAIATPGDTAIAAVAGTYYRFAANVDTLAVTLPTMTDASKVTTVVLYLTTGTAPAVTFASSHPVVYQDGFALEASKTYEVNCLFNGAAWVLMAAEINTGS